MVIYRTFDEQIKGIYIAQFTDCSFYETPLAYENEISKSLDELTDPLRIRELIKSPKSGWKKGDYKNTPINNLVQDVLNEVDDLIETFEDLKNEAQTNSNDWLLDNFIPLSNKDVLHKPERLKMYTYEYGSLLRLYGVQLGSDTVMITGITVKLVGRMKDCYLTQLELKKMNHLRSWLLEKNITHSDQL